VVEWELSLDEVGLKEGVPRKSVVGGGKGNVHSKAVFVGGK